MELRHLRYFVAIAEELSFRRAAELVRVAQPALSQQIRQLEAEMGVALFTRSSHKVALTASGQAFYVRARKILREAEQAVTEARSVGLGEAGTLSLGFVSAAAISVLPSLLDFLRSNLPLVEIELRELAPGPQIESLYQNRLDLGLFHAELKDALFETVIVTRERLMAALPAGSRFARRKSIDLREIADETIILPARHATPGYFERVRTAFQAAGVMPQRIYHTSLLQTGLLLAGAGLGLTLVPESFHRIRVEGVKYRPLTNDPPTIDLIAAWRRDNNSPLLARVTQHIKQSSVSGG